jgi:hypothetical protein
MPLCHSAWVPGCAADLTALHVSWSCAATRLGALGRAGHGPGQTDGYTAASSKPHAAEPHLQNRPPHELETTQVGFSSSSGLTHLSPLLSNLKPSLLHVSVYFLNCLWSIGAVLFT